VDPHQARELEGTEIAKIQAAHPPDRPISTLEGLELHSAFVGIASKVAVALDREPSGSATPK